MDITKNLIKKMYLENNSKYFDNKLQMTRIDYRIDHSIHNLAGCCFLHKNNKLHIKFYVSDMYAWKEETLNLIILHEMIHIYLYMMFKDGDRKHHTKFKNACTEFYNKFNISIPIDGSFVPLNEQGIKAKNAIKKTKNIFLIALNYIINKF